MPIEAYYSIIIVVVFFLLMFAAFCFDPNGGDKPRNGVICLVIMSLLLIFPFAVRHPYKTIIVRYKAELTENNIPFIVLRNGEIITLSEHLGRNVEKGETINVVQGYRSYSILFRDTYYVRQYKLNLENGELP